MADNRRRVLAEVLSIDAWHDPFRIDGRTSAVHVEVSFQQGRMGGDDAKVPFTFRIGLRRALLTVKLEEPLAIKRSSVARDIPEKPAELSTFLTAKKVAKSNISTKGELNPSKFSLAVSGGASFDREATKEEQMKVIQEVPRILATSRPRSTTEYAWDLQPAYEELLEGQPWHPTDAPRLEVRHPGRFLKIDPTIKVTLSCALEDISITELQPKSAGLVETIKHAVTNDISYAAAVQYLKTVLLSADLRVDKLDGRFSDLSIADVLSKAEEPDG